jgi:hypothetical protein
MYQKVTLVAAGVFIKSQIKITEKGVKITYVINMNRIRKNKEKLIDIMGPKMFKMMEKIKTHYDDTYFQLTKDERNRIVDEVTALILHTTLNFFNQYTPEELPDIYDLTIINLSQMEEFFVEAELYGFAQMLRDSILTLENDISDLAEPQL